MKSKVNEIKNKTDNSQGIVSTIFLLAFIVLSVINFMFIPILFALIIFILILFPGIIYILLGKVTRRWGLSILFALLIQILVLAVIGIWLYTDATSLINNFQNQPKYIVYTENNDVVFASNFNPGNNLNFSEIPESEIKPLLETQNKKDKFLIFIDAKIFDPLDENIQVPFGDTTQEISKQEAFGILRSGNPFNQVISYLKKTNPELSSTLGLLSEQQASELSNQLFQSLEVKKDSIKTIVLAILLEETVKKEGIGYIFDSIDNNIIYIKPDSYASIWIIKHIPKEQLKQFLPPELTSF